MLVYLNTDSWVALLRTDPTVEQQYAAFFERSGVQLGISWAHIEEIMRLPDYDARWLTRNLRKLPDVRVELGTVWLSEVEEQFAYLLGRKLQLKLFQERSLVDVHSHLERAPVPDPEPPEEAQRAQAAALDELKPHLPQLPWLAKLPASTLEVVMETIEAVGIRKSLETGCGIHDFAVVDKVPDENLWSVAQFCWAADVRTWDVQKAYDIGIEDARSLSRAPNPYLAPGFRCKLALETGHSRSGNPPALQLAEAEHVIFAPYVDLLFVSGQTYECLRRAANQTDTPFRFAVPGSVRAASTLEGVQAVWRRQVVDGRRSRSA